MALAVLSLLELDQVGQDGHGASSARATTSVGNARRTAGQETIVAGTVQVARGERDLLGRPGRTAQS